MPALSARPHAAWRLPAASGVPEESRRTQDSPHLPCPEWPALAICKMTVCGWPSGTGRWGLLLPACVLERMEFQHTARQGQRGCSV